MIKTKYKLAITSTLIIAASTVIVGVSYYYNSNSTNYKYYYTIPNSSSNDDLIQAYFASAVNGANLIYLPSYVHTTSLTNALSINEEQNASIFNYLSKVGYLLLDDSYGDPIFKTDAKTGEIIGLDGNQPIWSTNVASVQFRADLGSFVTGIALAEFLNENQHYFGKNLTWATYGGMPFETVTCFMGGFQRGVDFFNKYIQPKVNGYVKVEQIKLSDDSNSNFANSFDPNGANSLIMRFLDRNISAIIPVASPQIQNVVRFIQQRNLKTVVIGVDTASEEDTSINLPLPQNGDNVGNGNIIQFSSVKNLGTMLSKITNEINQGQLYNSENDNDSTMKYIGGLGYSSLGTLFNDGVGVSTSGQKYFVRAMKLLMDEGDKNSILNLTTNHEDYLNEISNVNNTLLQNSFKELNLPENKTYLNWSYSNISNVGKKMIPIAGDDNEIKQWLIENNQTYSNVQIEKCLTLIMEWKNHNQLSLKLRQQLNLKGKLERQNYLSNKNITKIVFQSPTSILFDNGFYQSCYFGLVGYWKTKEIFLPIKK